MFTGHLSQATMSGSFVPKKKSWNTVMFSDVSKYSSLLGNGIFETVQKIAICQQFENRLVTWCIYLKYNAIIDLSKMMFVKEIITGKCSSLKLVSDAYGENSDWQYDYGLEDGQNTCYGIVLYLFWTFTESNCNDVFKIEEF